MLRTAVLLGVAAATLIATPAYAASTCSIGSHVGVKDEEVAAIRQVVCDAVIDSQWAPDVDHVIDVTRIGSKIVLRLRAQRAGYGLEQKELVLTSMDEVPTAALRLAEATSQQKPVVETATVTNIVGDEARTPKKRPSFVHGWLGVFGAGAYGGGTGGGVNAALSAGSETWSFVSDLRLAGESFNKPAALTAEIFTLGSVDIKPDAELSFVSLSAGGRHHVMATNVSPFVGIGLGLDYLAQNKEKLNEYGSVRRTSNGKTGLVGYAELGLDILRTHTVGGAIVARADLPTFTLDSSEPHPNEPGRYLRSSTYAPVISAGICLRF